MKEINFDLENDVICIRPKYLVRDQFGKIDLQASLSKLTSDLNKHLDNEKNKKASKVSGSKIARSGIESEINIVDQFDNWPHSGVALEIVVQLSNIAHFNINDILNVKAYLWKDFPQINSKQRKQKHKTDVILEIKFRNNDTPCFYTISQKKSTIGLNQLDRRWVKNYQGILSIPDDVSTLLKFFTGEIDPSQYVGIDLSSLKDHRRLYFDEMNSCDQEKVKFWFKNNINSLLKFALIGQQIIFPPQYLLIEKVSEDGYFYGICNIDNAIKLYSGNGEVSFSKSGNLYLGSSNSREAVSIQRKGGDGGAETAKNLQIKFNPLYALDELCNIPTI